MLDAKKSALENVVLILFGEDDHFAYLREPNRSRDGKVNVGGTPDFVCVG